MTAPQNGATEQWINRIHTGECRDVMGEWPESSIHCCITSPPYWGLRDYGTDGQIGMESSVGEFVDEIVDVGRSIRRVLRPDGSWWLNLGDTYAGGGGVAGKPDDWDDMHDDENYPSDPPAKNAGYPSKSKLLVPHRVAIALIDDGWIVRNDAIWRKKGGGMPESVKDRLSTTTESVFHLVPQESYWYDLDAIRVPYASKTMRMLDEDCKGGKQSTESAPDSHWINDPDRKRGDFIHPSGKNPGDVFHESVATFPDAHFAVMPESLVDPLIKATCPPKVCAGCGTPYERDVERAGQPPEPEHRNPTKRLDSGQAGNADSGNMGFRASRLSGQEMSEWRRNNPDTFKGWLKQCECETDETEPGIAIDPFVGAGTVPKVAKDHGRRFVGIDLSPEYVSMAQARCGLDVDDPSVLSDDGQNHLGQFAVTDGGAE